MKPSFRPISNDLLKDYASVPIRTRLEQVEALRQIFLKLHKPYGRPRVLSFKSWKDYLKYRQHAPDLC